MGGGALHYGHHPANTNTRTLNTCATKTEGKGHS